MSKKKKKRTSVDLKQQDDKLFKTTYSIPAEAESFLKSYLASDLTELLDWTTIQCLDKEFIDEQFKKSK